jgi:hypothetical protein
MGCLRRLGCLVAVLAVAAALWYERAHWLPYFRHPGSGGSGSVTAPAPAGPPWELVTTDDAARGKAAVRKLAGKTGPVFVNLTGPEFVAYVMDSLSHVIPSTALGTTATVIGDQVFVRTMMPPSEFGAEELPDALRVVLADREPVVLGGGLSLARPGLLAFQVRTLRVRDFGIPSPGIPSIVKHLGQGDRPARFPADAIPLMVPINVADVRVHDGKITLYKTGQ